MSNINFSIIKFLSDEESPIVFSLPLDIFNISLNSSDNKNLSLTSLLNNSLLKAFTDSKVDNIIVIREGVSMDEGSIINLNFPFEKYPRLGISFPQICEKLDDSYSDYYSIFNLTYNLYMPPELASEQLSFDVFSPIFRGLIFSISRDTFNKVGLFNEKYLTDYCFIDYSIRCTKMRIRMVCTHNSFAFNSLFNTETWNLPASDEIIENDVTLLENDYGQDLSIYNIIQGKTVVECQIYNQNHLLEAWLKNVNEFVDEIVILYSKEPWGHNPSALNILKPDNSGEILEKYSKILNKLTIFEGNWKDETYERNLGLEYAKQIGGRYLIVIDSDEFYEKEEIFKAYDFMVDNPTDIYIMNTIQMVKKINWAAFPKEGYPLCNFAINLRSPIKFLATRIVAGESILIPFEVCKCYHLSYLLPKDKLEQKLLTSFHFIEFLNGWYENVWPNINLSSKNFHPTHPDSWSYMKDIPLPYNIIKDIDYLKSDEFR